MPLHEVGDPCTWLPKAGLGFIPARDPNTPRHATKHHVYLIVHNNYAEWDILQKMKFNPWRSSSMIKAIDTQFLFGSQSSKSFLVVECRGRKKSKTDAFFRIVALVRNRWEEAASTQSRISPEASTLPLPLPLILLLVRLLYLNSLRVSKHLSLDY